MYQLPPPPSLNNTPPPYKVPSPYARPTPIVDPMHTGEQFRLPPPPALASALNGFTTQNSIPVSSLAYSLTSNGTTTPVSGVEEQKYLKRRPVPGSVTDGVSYGVLTAFKIVRIMVLWIALYFVDRAYQSAYLSRVMVEGASPPSLLTVAAAALAIEAVFAAAFVGLIWMLSGRFKNDHNTFALDAPLISTMWQHYLQSTIVILALGTAFGAVAQSRKNLRYGEDGMRGIRALCTAIMLVSIVIIMVL